jgi:hypothetical protein
MERKGKIKWKEKFSQILTKENSSVSFFSFFKKQILKMESGISPCVNSKEREYNRLYHFNSLFYYYPNSHTLWERDHESTLIRSLCVRWGTSEILMVVNSEDFLFHSSRNRTKRKENLAFQKTNPLSQLLPFFGLKRSVRKQRSLQAHAISFRSLRPTKNYFNKKSHYSKILGEVEI